MSPEAPPDRPPEPSDHPSPLEAVRSAVAQVAGWAEVVRLVPERLAPYARQLLDERVLDPLALAGPHPPTANRHPETVAGRVIALDTINFGSGWHPVVRKNLGRSGATNMASGLTRWLATDSVVRPERLAHLDTEKAHLIFDQPHDGGPVDELMGLFTVALNDLGHLVLDRYDGSFTELVETADGSAATLVDLLAEMPFFRDVSSYEGLDVPLYKRAQITSADLHRAFRGQSLGRFDDLDRLTAFADNLVPHVLRIDGVLTFDDDLVARIEHGELLRAGSPEEVEIRAVGVHAVEGLRTALAELGRDVPPWQLDQVLWERGARPRYKAEPRHRARSVFY